MPTFRALSRLAGLLSLGVVSLGASAGPAPQADAAAIRELIQRSEALNNAGDVEGWTALFEDGAVYMPPGLPAVTTREGLRAIARAGFTSWRSRIRMQTEEIVPSGDWAFARSLVTGTATPAAGGDPVTIDIKEIAIYHRQRDGSWKIARLIANSNR
jgi:ketosteroid isomerase-like protein